MSDEKNISNDETSHPQASFNSSVDATLMAPTPTPEISKFQQIAQETEAQCRNQSTGNPELPTSVHDGAMFAMKLLSQQFHFFAKLNSNAWSTAMHYWLTANEQSSKHYFQPLNTFVHAFYLASNHTGEASKAN